VGGSGYRLLEVGAELANEINLTLPLNKISKRVQFIRNYCEKIGRNPKELHFSINRNLVIAEDENGVQSLLENFKPSFRKDKKQTRKELLETSYVGTPDMIYNQICEYKKLGISRFIIVVYDWIPEQLNLFSTKVMNKFT
jgi:alkanesulfonate monooxygenase SsuD/methylene tetrahydromethanopterin reductase-like flavin-dependent oxidoreductase (luciferase family)